LKPNKYLLFLLLTVVVYGLIEYYRPKPIDWTPTYSNKHTRPFGTQALYELLPEVMNHQPVTSVRMPVDNQLTETTLPRRSNYVFVCQTLRLYPSEQKALLAYVQRGNNVFLSAYEFPADLSRKLGFKASLKAPFLRDTTVGVNFSNPALKAPANYRFPYDDGRNFLTVKTAKNITVLGRNSRQEPVFLKIQHGKGTFYIHNLPLAFTNYYVLDPKTADYAFKTLSYLPPLPTLWDEYQKQGRFDEEDQTPLRYVLTQPALTWAYYLILASLVLYVLFAGKRTQRIIPVVEPLKNTSLEFVQTIGRLYFQRGDHANLAQKKIGHFLLFVRERFQLATTVPDEDFKQTLARKSGVPVEEVNALFSQIALTGQQARISEYELLRINQLIDNFYHQVKA